MAATDTSPKPLVATIHREGLEIKGEIEKVTARGCILSVADGGARYVPLLDDLELRISGGSLREPMIFKAMSICWRAVRDREHLDLELPKADYPRLREVLQQSRGIRIPVVGTKAVRAKVRSLTVDVEIETAIIDISERGLALILSRNGDRTLADTQRDAGGEANWLVAVTFALPGSRDEMHQIGQICYRMFTRKCVKYGVRFMPELTQRSFPDELHSVGEQIMSYQQHLIENGKLSRAS